MYFSNYYNVVLSSNLLLMLLLLRHHVYHCSLAQFLVKKGTRTFFTRLSERARIFFPPCQKGHKFSLSKRALSDPCQRGHFLVLVKKLSKRALSDPCQRGHFLVLCQKGQSCFIRSRIIDCYTLDG